MKERQQIQKLQRAFKTAHRKGMAALAGKDLVALTEAVEAETAVVEEQRALIDEHLRRSAHLGADRPKIRTRKL